MLPRNQPDGIQIAFDDHRLVNNAGLILPATLALHLGLSQLVDRHLDLGRAPGRANTGDKIMTLVASALAGGDCIDDADVLRTGAATRCARPKPGSLPLCRNFEPNIYSHPGRTGCPAHDSSGTTGRPAATGDDCPTLTPEGVGEAAAKEGPAFPNPAAAHRTDDAARLGREHGLPGDYQEVCRVPIEPCVDFPGGQQRRFRTNVGGESPGPRLENAIK